MTGLMMINEKCFAPLRWALMRSEKNFLLIKRKKKKRKERKAEGKVMGLCSSTELFPCSTDPPLSLCSCWAGAGWLLSPCNVGIPVSTGRCRSHPVCYPPFCPTSHISARFGMPPPAPDMNQGQLLWGEGHAGPQKARSKSTATPVSQRRSLTVQRLSLVFKPWSKLSSEGHCYSQLLRQKSLMLRMPALSKASAAFL